MSAEDKCSAEVIDLVSDDGEVIYMPSTTPIGLLNCKVKHDVPLHPCYDPDDFEASRLRILEYEIKRYVPDESDDDLWSRLHDFGINSSWYHKG